MPTFLSVATLRGWSIEDSRSSQRSGTRSMRSERFFSICCGGKRRIKSKAQSNCWSVCNLCHLSNLNGKWVMIKRLTMAGRGRCDWWWTHYELLIRFFDKIWYKVWFASKFHSLPTRRLNFIISNLKSMSYESCKSLNFLSLKNYKIKLKIYLLKLKIIFNKLESKIVDLKVLEANIIQKKCLKFLVWYL